MKMFKRTAAVLLAVILVTAAVCSLPMTASAYAKPQNSLTVRAESNFFGDSEAFYSDLSQYEDENGDVFITVRFNMLARGKFLVNFDLGELTWDPSVLEWKEAYNMYERKLPRGGSVTLFDMFPVVAETGFGTGTYNSFDDKNCGRVVGNFTAVAPAAKAYGAGDTPVTVVKAVFKVLDRTAGATTVNCLMEDIAVCDDTVKQPYAQDKLVHEFVAVAANAHMAEKAVLIAPDTQAPVVGDVDGSGTLTINDVTLAQRMLCEFTGEDGKPLYDETDARLFAAADINGDGVFNVHDITAAQRILAEF